MWLTIEEVATLENKAKRTIERKIAKGEYPASAIRKVAGSGGKDGKRTEINIETLPAPLQHKYYEQAGTMQTALALPDDGEDVRLLDVDPARREAAQRRKALVLEFRLFRDRFGRGHGADTLAAALDRWLAAKQAGVKRARLYAWDQAYGDGGRDGLLALAPKAPERSIRAIDAGMAAVVEQYYLTQARRSVTYTYKQVCEHCAGRGLPAPAERTLRRYIAQRYSPAVQSYFRQGEGKWRRVFECLVHRDYGTLEVNDLWCGDQRTMDTLLKLPTKTKYTYFRPTLSLWVDVKSAAIVGYHVSYEQDAYMIALSLRRGFKRFGLPQGVYMDNGKQYRAIYLQGPEFKQGDPFRLDYNRDTQYLLDAHNIAYKYDPVEYGILDALDIDVRHSRPVNTLNPGALNGGVARAKPIEPLFNNFHEFEQNLPGWCGHNTLAVPEKLKREIKADKLLTLAEYVQLIEAFIVEYNQRAHGWRPMPSIDFYQDFQATFAPPRDLDLLMRPKKQVMVRHAEVDLHGVGRHFGVSFLPGLWYTSPELTMYSGQYVVIWHDPLDLSSVIITTAGPHPEFICEVQKAELMGWQATSTDYKEHVLKPRKAARAAMKAQQQHRDVLDTRPEDLLREAKQQIAQGALRAGELVEPPGPAQGIVQLTPISDLARDLAQARQAAAAPAAPAELPAGKPQLKLVPKRTPALPAVTLDDLFEATQAAAPAAEEEDDDGLTRLWRPTAAPAPEKPFSMADLYQDQPTNEDEDEDKGA